MEIPPVLAYALGWFALGSGIWTIFERAETVVTDEVRISISRWLKNLDPGKGSKNWSDSFGRVFDGVFTENHLSWACFWRSCVASFAAVIIVAVIYLSVQQELFTEEFELRDLMGLAMLVAAFNLIPDYISLLETRYILKAMERVENTVVIFGLLIFDVAATVAVFAVMGFPLGGALLDVILTPAGFEGLAQDYVRVFLQAPIWLTDLFLLRDSLGIFLWSTFFTSGWIWLYLLGGLTVKTVAFVGVGLDRFRRIFDIEHKPLRSIGMVCNLGITLAFLIALAIP